MNVKDLLVYKHKDEILKSLKENQVLIIESPTGSGKTTGIPIILHEAKLDQDGMIGITQPRRIAAMNVTSFIKNQLSLDEKNNTVALKMRFQDDTDQSTQIKIMTDGILLEELKQDRMLSKYSVIMVDEAHERSLNIDFILGLLKEIIRVRSDLKVIISSATINPKEFSKFFDDAPILSIQGKAYDVDIKYMPLNTEVPKDVKNRRLFQDDIKIKTIVSIVEKEVKKKSGDILIFLSGEAIIKKVYSALKYSKVSKKLDIYPLYSRLSKEDQNSVFNKTKHGLTKVVVSTNIAETSITIDGITVVIDSGEAKNNYYNGYNFTSSLVEGKISRSNASQRSGRAGRTQNGVCYRLYSKEDFDARPMFSEPEITRSDLSDVVLRSIDLGIKDAENFPFISPVHIASITSAYDTLKLLAAIDKDRNITEEGAFMMRFPLSVRHAKIVAESVFRYPGAIKKILVAVSFISTKSPFVSIDETNEEDARIVWNKYRTKDGDFVAFLRIFEEYTSLATTEEKKHYADVHYLDYESMSEIECVCNQLEEILSDMMIPISDNCSLSEYMICIAEGLKQFIARRDERTRRSFKNVEKSKKFSEYTYITVTGEREVLSMSTLMLGYPDFIVSAEVSGSGRMFARTVSPLKSEWLSLLSDDVFKMFYSNYGKKKKAERERPKVKDNGKSGKKPRKKSKKSKKKSSK